MLSKLFPQGMRRRWWAFRPIDWIVALCPAKKPASDGRGRVLVVRMDGIGDMVLHRRALDYLPDALGVDKSDITVLGCKSWAGLADRVFSGFKVVAIDEHAYEKRWFYRLRISLWVRRQGFETAVCDMFMRKVMTADSLVWASRAARRIVCRPFITPRTQREWDWYLGLATRVIDTGEYPTHDGIRHFRFLSALAGREIAPQVPSLSWAARPSPVAAGAPYVVMNFGSNEPGRRWPLANFIALARRVRERGLRVVFVGGAAEAFGIPAIDALNDPGVIDAVGKWTLGEVVDAMAASACVVTNDTGPGHLALGAGARTVLIAGGGHWGSFVPYPAEIQPPGTVFLTLEMECFHCLWRCPKRASPSEPFPCVSGVSLDRVWDGLLPLLKL